MKKIYSILSILCAAFLAVSCTLDKVNTEEMGYLKVEVNTVETTHTRVTSKPSDYDAKKLHVDVINEAGTIVLSTDDLANDDNFKGNILLAPGKYTVSVHSAGWDGSDSAFGAPYYSGMTRVTVTAKTLVTANVTCTLATVKVTVNWDQSFRDNFSTAQTIITSDLDDVSLRNFKMGTTVGSAYFPVAPLNLMLSVTNKSGQQWGKTDRIEDPQARDHFIITYKVAEGGKMGGVTVYVDDATQTYTYTIEVPRKSSTALEAKPANAWGNFAMLSGMVTAKTSDFVADNVVLQWKKQSDADWTTVANSALTVSGDNYSYKLLSLSPATDYRYRFQYKKDDVEVNSNEVAFKTDPMTEITNGGFENWYKDGSVWYPNADANNHFWDSSNPGSASMGESYNVTTKSTTDVHSGTGAARLGSTYVIIKFAAASIYSGEFDHLVGTKGAVLNWGQPFTARPTAFKGWMKYTPGSINRGSQPSGVGAPAKNENDVCQIYCALLTERLTIDNTDMSTFPAWDGSDPRIIAYGSLTQNTSDANWKQFNIPLTYYNATRKPTHVLIVCSSSKYGDYFYGSDSSVLLLDDFEFEYGTEPTIQ
ncbi:MAG: PCMD domain-containing protein [Bacteroidaceae bacterium]|nr:PCMD domain-containing protein [Bacteroidaceae bacterium]